MSTQPITFLVEDQNEAPVVGAALAVFDTSLHTVYCRGVTDSQGKVYTLLPGGVDVDIRVQHPYARTRPLTIISLDDAPTQYTLPVVLWTPPTALDPRRCMVWLRVAKPDGQAWADCTVTFRPGSDAGVAGKEPVIGASAYYVTDDNGYMQAPLLKNSKVRVEMGPTSDSSKTVRIPEVDNINLLDLLYPYVKSFTYTPPGPLAVGSTTAFDLNPSWSDYVDRIDDDTEFVEWSSSDQNLVTVTGSTRRLELYAKAPGTVTITATRVRSSTYRSPSPELTNSSFSVSVVLWRSPRRS